MSSKEYTCYMFVNTSLKLKPGKVAAQTAHAMRILMNNLQNQSKFTKESWYVWENQGSKTIILKAVNENEMEEIHNSFPSIIVQDAGRTQCKPGSLTVLALYPKQETVFLNKLY
jgi:PTH2 family peptidyl-tRNA hydrolase